MFSRAAGVVILAALVVLIGAADAFAWGPATHVEIGRTVLDHLALLPAGWAALLARHRRAYLYGNIAADIVFAKRWSRVKQFCHHWSTAFALLEDATESKDRAFALGYLSHLAADTVAHGKFVPRQILGSDCSVNFGHFYWELRGDALQPDGAWSRVNNLLAANQDRHHLSLERHITDTLLSYEMNRLLFERMNAFAVRKGFRRTIGVWSRFSRFDLPHGLLSGYLDESVDRVQSVLTEGRRSSILREDPNGTSALMQLRVQRRESRRMRRKGLGVELRRSEAARGLSPRESTGDRAKRLSGAESPSS